MIQRYLDMCAVMSGAKNFVSCNTDYVFFFFIFYIYGWIFFCEKAIFHFIYMGGRLYSIQELQLVIELLGCKKKFVLFFYTLSDINTLRSDIENLMLGKVLLPVFTYIYM